MNVHESVLSNIGRTRNLFSFFVYKNVGVLNLSFHITNPNLI